MPTERETLFSRYADYIHNKNKFPVTRYGEVVIYSSEHPNIIAYIKGDIGNPTVTKIVRVNASNETLSEISEEILHNERKRVLLPYQNVSDLYKDEILTINKRKDYASFREYQSGQERGYGEENNSTDNQVKIGNGNLQSNKANDRADGLTPAFSMPESDKQ